MPIEHLDRHGVSRDFFDFATTRCGWPAAQLDLIGVGFQRYWERSDALATRTPTWMPPRRRNLAVVADPLAVRPYVQLLNTSTWLLYASDVDPERSDPEFLAYLLALGDRMAITREVTQAAIHNAPWWYDRTPEECAAFTAAAERSTRPDAAAFQALARAVPWLKQLRHQTLDPPRVASPHRAIPGSGLLVPRALEGEPPALVSAWASAARGAVARFHARWHGSDPAAVSSLCEWLRETAPRLLVMGQNERVLWDPEHPDRLGSLRDVLKPADGVAVHAIAADLRTVDDHTRRFFAALVDPAALPAPAANTLHLGLSFLHRERRLIAYNVQEAGMSRLQGPDVPYERAMVGARTAHEWAHLADTAGWVTRTVAPEDWKGRRAVLAGLLASIIERAPDAVKRWTGADRAELGREKPVGDAMVGILVSRMPDFRANLLAQHFLSMAERETYVRHNIRTLNADYTPPQLWRMLLRYVFEYQYLRFSALADPRTFFLESTSCREDFLGSHILDDETFDALTRAVGALCDGYAVDATRFRFDTPAAAV